MVSVLESFGSTPEIAENLTQHLVT